MTLTEVLVVLAIFSIVIAVVYGVYVKGIKHTTREHRVAESEMELEILKNFLERDIALAGYGLADDYDFDSNGTQNFTPRAIGSANTDPDTLTLMGTALGRLSRGSQGWSYIMTATPTFKMWNDARENVQVNDRVIYVEPHTKTLLASGGNWRFIYPNSPTTERGSIVYGLTTEPQAGDPEITQPYHIVQYTLGGTTPATCAPGTQSLLRAETSAPANPVLDCISDFQVALGLDINEDGTIDCWDNGGVLAATYDNRVLKKRLKQMKVYMLAQIGMRDPETVVYPAGQSFRVGDNTLIACAGGTVGRDVPLTDVQRWYRWRVISLGITPRNLR